MLQALIVRVNEFVLGSAEQTFQPIPGVAEEAASEVTLGVYGLEAVRASGHQRGAGHLPKRKFLGANERDKELMLREVTNRIMVRVAKILNISGTPGGLKDNL
jgi:hypothetical protein